MSLDEPFSKITAIRMRQSIALSFYSFCSARHLLLFSLATPYPLLNTFIYAELITLLATCIPLSMRMIKCLCVYLAYNKQRLALWLSPNLFSSTDNLLMCVVFSYL